MADDHERLGGTRMGRRGWAAAAALLVLVLVSGCRASTDEPTGSGVDTATPTATPTASASTGETPTIPEPVEPATGVALDVKDIRVRAPQEFEQTFDTIFVDTAVGRVGGRSASLLLSVAGTSGEQLSLKQAERYFWSPGQRPPNFRRQDTVVVGGLTAGYYTARDKYSDVHVATLWDSGSVIKVEIRFARPVADGRQQELFESVLASYSSPRTR